MIEQGPKEYEYKHNTVVTLAEYKGVGRDLIRINEPVTDGFMQTTDMRSDIVIVQKDPDALNVQEVDRLRRVLNKKPRKVWQNDQTTEVRHDHQTDTWYLGINDTKLAEKIKLGSTKITFDEQYTTAFQSEIAKGLRSILKREKLLNSGKFNDTFLMSYGGMNLSFFAFTFAETAILFSAKSLPEVAIGTIAGSLLFVNLSIFTNLVTNSANSGYAWLRNKDIFRYSEKYTRSYEKISLNDPFIKHKAVEYLFPPVPIDKLVSGIVYLNRNQNNLLKI